MRKLRFRSQGVKKTQENPLPLNNIQPVGTGIWNQAGAERTGMSKISGFGGILKWKEKNKTTSFSNKLGLHPGILWKHLLISLYPLPVLGRIPR